MSYNFDEIYDRSKSDSLKYVARDKMFGTNDVMPFWVADTDFKTPPFICDAIQKRAEHEVFGYPMQNESYKEAIINWNGIRNRWKIDQSWIHYFPNVVISLGAMVQIFSEPGDQIIVQPPVYFPFFDVVKFNDRKILENVLIRENNSYTIDFDDLEEKAKQAKMMLICNPHNPIGRVWTTEELEKISEICLRNSVIMISDEIHSDLVFGDRRHKPLASISTEVANQTVTLMAPSKTFNIAGLSSAFTISSNRKFQEQIEHYQNGSHTNSMNIFALLASEAAYTSGHEWVDELKIYLEGNFRFMQDHLKKHVPNLGITKAEGTYLAWLDFSSYSNNDVKINQALIDAGLGLNRGISFGAKSGKGFMRMNFGCPRSVLHEGLMKFEEVKNILT